jgi:hypothetical protein
MAEPFHAGALGARALATDCVFLAGDAGFTRSRATGWPNDLAALVKQTVSNIDGGETRIGQ